MGKEADDRGWKGLAEDLKERTEVEEIEAQDETIGGEDEARRVKPVMDPKLPSAKEVREHQLTHLPFRNWCLVCVKGRGCEANHQRQPRDEQGVPEYHMDYCFPGNEEGRRLTILVITEKTTRMRKGIVVPAKGSSGTYAAREVLSFIKECGDQNNTIVIRTDQEPAIRCLVEDVRVARTGAKTLVEESPVGSKGSNGIAERAVRSVEEYFRTMKMALDVRVKAKVDVRHPI